MSLGYAQKLSYREDVGAVGMSELFEPPEMLHQKRAGKGVPEASLPFHCAMPSPTHMALVELERAGILKFVISQNVDSLHLRSGIPREKLAELHGNSFREVCPSCGAEYIRDFEIETIGMKETPRRCSNLKCGSKLRDTVLDWEDALPRKEMNAAAKHCKKADLVLCLGTSLQITPACNLPLKCIRGGGRIVIVNLQKTPKDKKATLVIHGLVDKVIAGIMVLMKLQIPPYVRIDLIQFGLSHSLKERTYVKWTLKISSVHGQKAPLPFVKSVEVLFPDRPDLKTAFLLKQPFCLRRETAIAKPFKITLKLNFSEGCGCSSTLVDWMADFNLTGESFKLEKDAIFEKLRVAATEGSSCGQYATIERNAIPGDETYTRAFVTNFCDYSSSVFRLVSTPTSDSVSLKGCDEDMNNLMKPLKDESQQPDDVTVKECKGLNGCAIFMDKQDSVSDFPERHTYTSDDQIPQTDGIRNNSDFILKRCNSCLDVVEQDPKRLRL